MPVPGQSRSAGMSRDVTFERNEVRSHEFIMAGFDGAVSADCLGSSDFIANSRQWEIVGPTATCGRAGS